MHLAQPVRDKNPRWEKKTKKAEGDGLVLTKTAPTDVLWKFSLNLFDSYLRCDLQFTFCAGQAELSIY